MNIRPVIILSAAWIFLVGFGTYSIIGYSAPNVRIYFGGIFGLLLLPTFLFGQKKKVWVRGIYVLLMASSISWGLVNYFVHISMDREEMRSELIYFDSVTHIISGIKERSNILLINHSMSKTGCGPAFMILYQTKNLTCGFLSNVEDEFLAERFTGLVNAHQGGWLRNENTILIALDENNEPYILDEITPDGDLLIEWYVPDPIRTDYKRLEDNYEYLQSPMYLYIQKLLTEIN
jgi:hypothetical protein